MKKTILLLLGILVLTAFSQQRVVSSKVTDSKGVAIPGAIVKSKSNLKIATVTDFDGSFQITIPIDSILTVEFIGLETQAFIVTEDNLIPYGKTTKKEYQHSPSIIGLPT